MSNKRHIIFSCILIAAMMLAAGAGCQKKAGDAAKKGAGKETVLAEFDGGKVTAEQVNDFLDSLNPMYRMQFQDPQRKDMLINQIIESTILAKAAKTEGIDKDPETQTMIDLQINGILASRYYEKKIKILGDKVTVTDTDLKQHYDAHPEEFDKAKIKARHILVDNESDAKAIYEQVKANLNLFAQIAKSKSKDPSSAGMGGELGWFERGRMVPEFENVAFSTPKGQIAPPVQTRFGWHIINVEDKSETGVTPFEEAKETIRANLTETKKKEAIEKAVSDLKTKAKLKVHTELFSKVGEQQAAPGAAPGMPPAPPATPQSAQPQPAQ